MGDICDDVDLVVDRYRISCVHEVLFEGFKSGSHDMRATKKPGSIVSFLLQVKERRRGIHFATATVHAQVVKEQLAT